MTGRAAHDAQTTELRALLATDELLRGAPAEVLALCAERAVRQQVTAGTVVLQAADASMALYLVAEGQVRIVRPGSSEDPGALMLGAGEWIGAIEAVTGTRAESTVLAAEACTLLVFDSALQREISARFEPFAVRLAQLATRAQRERVFRYTLAILFEDLDAALLAELLNSATEVTLARGATLMREGDPSDAWYVLTSGRLGVITAAGTRRGADLLPGASIGEIGLITGGPRTATIVADRDASLMRLARADFERFADTHPAFTRRLMGMVVQRLIGPTGQSAARKAAGARIAVLLPASDSPSMQAAVAQLGESMRATGAALHTRASFEAAVGRSIDRVAATDPMHPLWNQFDVWLETCQATHELLVLDAGCTDDLWQRECLQRADRCLWLAEPVAPESARAPEPARTRLRAILRALGPVDRGIRCTLLLLHPAGTQAPQNTRAWLDEGCFDRHLHLRLDDRSTMDRAARLLAGTAHGLALSGGGARGFAHIGVLRAFTELGVPIDCIGGTSMGAIQAGMHAMGMSTAQMIEMNRYVVSQRPFSEYTLPMVALMASRRRDACIHASYGDALIEDLWLPFLAVSTDLNGGAPVIHERGPLGRAISASSAIPGVVVPVVDGERVLVDGGVLDNLPAELVKARCGGTLFASLVAPSDVVHAPPGGFPSAWSLLADQLLPWRTGRDARRPTPRIASLLLRALTLGSAEQMRRAAAHIDVLIEPEVTRWGMLQLRAMDPMVEAGYRAARERLLAWQTASATQVQVSN